MPAPSAILDLIARFNEHRASYLSPTYNETQLRREFLDPFFAALGWDVNNLQGYAEAYKEVIHEDALRVEGSARAPDYCFRVGGRRVFFVEAKKPSVNLKEDVSPAFQLRRYAWSAGLPLSILTDFQEFSVYDCRVRPDQGDKASTARILYLTCDELAARWEEIAGIFAKEAVLKGAFDKYAEAGKKRGTQGVDAAFLKEIEGWRDLLARTIALRNPDLTVEELNDAVGRTIDRIIFLRICEDRGIEEYGRLLAVTNGSGIYDRLKELFRRADDRYNSGLFHFQTEKGRPSHPDALTLRLAIDDKPLREIVRGLYYPQSPYEFSALPADILGQVYEQFLGRVIRLTAGHQAKVEEKPEVKKAGGVFYTPTWVVDYIVGNTVGKLLEGKTPKEAAGLRILDPACGSGSFLIGAYQHLLTWHRDWYSANDPERWAKGKNPVLYHASEGDWRLTTAERKRILIDSIFGVDIDAQAVEVTKLSLLLKVLEGENDETLNQQLRLFQERALPDLSENIKCGNSLIGPDFFDGKLELDQAERARINPFDWGAEFPEVFPRGAEAAVIARSAATKQSHREVATGPATPRNDGGGGFDAVIGNPPYVLLQDAFREDLQIEHFRHHYEAASFKIDTYHLFIERSLELTRQGGWCSMITPANFLTNNHLVKLRRVLLERSKIAKIAVIDGGVFRGVSVDNAIFVLSPGSTTEGLFTILHLKATPSSVEEHSATTLHPEVVSADPHMLFTPTDSDLASTWRRLEQASWPLGTIADVNFGKQLRDRKKFPSDVLQVDALRAVPLSHRPCYTGKDVSRYQLQWSGLACLDSLVARSGGCWEPSRHDARDKLVTRQIGVQPVFGLDAQGFHCLNTMFMVNVREGRVAPCYVLGILNSRLLGVLWRDRYYDQRRTFPKIKGTYLKLLPIRKINYSDPTDKRRHDEIVTLVERMLDLHKHLPATRAEHDRALVEREIKATDTRIDRLVYDLYDLTAEEIRLVEAGR